MLIPHPEAQKLRPLTEAEYASLKEDITRVGVKLPIIVAGNEILDGVHRYRVCSELGIEQPPMLRYEPLGEGRYADTEGVIQTARELVASLNIKRRQLTTVELARLANAEATLNPGRPEKTSSRELVSQPEAATKWGVGVATMKRVKAIDDSEESDLKEALGSGELSAKSAEKELRKRQRLKNEASRRKERDEALALSEATLADRLDRLDRLFEVVYADPPWRYEHSSAGDPHRAVERHYPTMTLAEICALPVEQRLAENAVLYLWATAPKLLEALEVMKVWGFDYRTNMVWVKDRIGLGYWARGRHELLLIGTRGQAAPPATSERPDSVIEAPRRKHSEKPEGVATMLSNLYQDRAKLELFARLPRPGWVVWGNELP